MQSITGRDGDFQKVSRWSPISSITTLADVFQQRQTIKNYGFRQITCLQSFYFLARWQGVGARLFGPIAVSLFHLLELWKSSSCFFPVIRSCFMRHVPTVGECISNHLQWQYLTTPPPCFSHGWNCNLHVTCSITIIRFHCLRCLEIKSNYIYVSHIFF